MNYRQHYKAAEKSEEELADMLAFGKPEDEIRAAAQAELRIREHRAILRQAEAADRSAAAAERAAEAAKKGADATAKYARYTFWILVFTALAAAAAWYAAFQHPH